MDMNTPGGYAARAQGLATDTSDDALFGFLLDVDRNTRSAEELQKLLQAIQAVRRSKETEQEKLRSRLRGDGEGSMGLALSASLIAGAIPGIIWATFLAFDKFVFHTGAVQNPVFLLCSAFLTFFLVLVCNIGTGRYFVRRSCAKSQPIVDEIHALEEEIKAVKSREKEIQAKILELGVNTPIRVNRLGPEKLN